MGKLFGTDGIRGKADEYPMTMEMVRKIGYAIIAVLCDGQRNPKVLIGRDTRASGEKFEKAIVSGIDQINGKAYLAGIIPTPAVSYVVSSGDFDAGIVISASHNPYDDNGIKIFDGNGYKLSDEKETEIENLALSNRVSDIQFSSKDVFNAQDYCQSVDYYSNYLKQCLDKRISLKGIKLVIDCANGSTFNVAPPLFSDLGAMVETLFSTPDGKNINDQCGSEYPEEMKKCVKEKNTDIGIAFDGDGDRLIVVDEKGDILTGDQMLAIFASFMKKQGKLKNNIVISTIMSNMGLSVAFKNMDIKHIMTEVGDRSVAEKMIETGAILGGENSGHIILMESQKTGDGLFSALKLLEIMKLSEKPLSELKKSMIVYPQTLINVEVKVKPDLKELPEVMHTIKKAEKKLGKEGRVLIRYSGTQPMCRVMVEGPNKDIANNLCNEIADIIRKKIPN